MPVSSVIRAAACVAALLCVAACGAPSSKTQVCRDAKAGQYCVQSGDSLSRIAQRFQTDVARLKAINGLRSDVIRPGDVLNLPKSARVVATATRFTPAVHTPPPRQTAAISPALSDAAMGLRLQWPLRGSIVLPYGANNKGIDIAAPRGALVYAAADGTVMYSGETVAGYGKLLLIRHNDSTVTAYANNDSLLVHEGATVKAGQIVASVGDSERKDGRTALHFEVRVNGKHVNPNLYLR